MATARTEVAASSGTAERRETAPHSLAAIYRRSLKDVCRWAASLGGPAIDADDVAQEVFLVVHRRLAQFQGDDPTPWLYAITLRVVRGMRRRAWVRRALLGGATSLDSFADPGPRPDENAER